jgi:cytochrome c oxidase assembly protein subunit 15
LTAFDITEVVRFHAGSAWLLLGLTVAAMAWLRRSGAPRAVDLRGAALVAAILAQGALGYLQYFSGVPPLLVGLHVAGSIVVWIAVLRFHLGLFAHPDEVGSPNEAQLATIQA